MTIPRQVLLDSVKNELLVHIIKIQQEKGLTAYDVETVMYQILTEIKADKETQYSDLILTMAQQITTLESKVKELSVGTKE